MQNFAKISGDTNPLHLDESYAKNAGFQTCLVHGMLSAAYISSVVGTIFPGIGTVYIAQNLKFLKPIYCGETVKIVVEIKELLQRNRAILSTNIINADYEVVLEGEAKVVLPPANQAAQP